MRKTMKNELENYYGFIFCRRCGRLVEISRCKIVIYEGYPTYLCEDCRKNYLWEA